MRHTRGRKVAAALFGVVLAASSLVSCGKDHGSKGGSDKPKSGPILTMFTGTQSPVVANFNPYSPTTLHATFSALYEPLFFYNKTKAEDPVPMLATKADWNADGTKITITLREGVKWNDGKPLTADDVVFSFTNDAAKKDDLKEAKAVDEHTVELTFASPNFVNEYGILGATYIVPKHVFAEVDDLVAFANDKDPVGTGPFMADAVTSASFTMKKNPNYWQKGRPGIDKVQYLAIDAESSAESLLKAGQLDFASFFVPEPDPVITAQKLGYVAVTSPNPVVVMTCSNAEMGCQGAQTDKSVRKALSVAIDRDEINEKAYHGLGTLASETLVNPTRDEKWVADGLDLQISGKADIDGAKKIMQDAGYTLGSDGIFAKDGKRVSIVLEAIEGTSDATAASQLMVAQAKKAGIELKLETVTNDQYTERRANGKFQMFYGAIVGTPISDPYAIYANSLSTKATKKVGEKLTAFERNYARYSNAEVDQAIETAAKTGDEKEKKEAYFAVQRHIVEDVPYIPMFHRDSQSFFNATLFTGWPSEEDLYAFPATWDGPSAAQILIRLDYK